LPATDALQETVAVPDPARLPGVIEPQFRPEGMVSIKVTVPEKPLRGVMEMVDRVEAPELTGVGIEAVMLKSWNLNVAVAEWTSEPLVPVIVSM